MSVLGCLVAVLSACSGDTSDTIPVAEATPVSSEATGSLDTENSPVTTVATSSALYVAVDGSDSQDGSAPERAVASLQHAVNQVSAGGTVFVRAGDYGLQQVVIEQSGEPGKPITIAGYQTLPGDSPNYPQFDENTTPDADVMPLFTASDRANDYTAIVVTGQYIEIKNLQLTGYKTGLESRGSDYLKLDNLVVSDLGDPSGNYEGRGIVVSADYAEVRNTTVVNAGAQGFTLSGSFNTIDNVSVYADDDSTGHRSATDYYFVLLNAYNNTITNCYIERVGDLSHVGHGFTVKGDGRNNVFDGNTAVNMKGGGFVARWTGAEKNTFKNGVVVGGDGILARDGAQGNLFENISISGTRFGVFFLNAMEDPANTSNIAAQNNHFKNIVVNDVSHSVFHFASYASDEALSVGNTFEGFTINGAPVLITADHLTENNALIDSVVSNVQRLATARPPRDAAEIDFRYQSNTLSATGFVLP